MKKISNLSGLMILITLMSGVAQAGPATAGNVPDIGSTSTLLALALGALAFVRRFAR